MIEKKVRGFLSTACLPSDPWGHLQVIGEIPVGRDFEVSERVWFNMADEGRLCNPDPERKHPNGGFWRLHVVKVENVNGDMEEVDGWVSSGTRNAPKYGNGHIHHHRHDGGC